MVDQIADVIYCVSHIRSFIEFDVCFDISQEIWDVDSVSCESYLFSIPKFVSEDILLIGGLSGDRIKGSPIAHDRL